MLYSVLVRAVPLVLSAERAHAYRSAGAVFEGEIHRSAWASGEGKIRNGTVTDLHWEVFKDPRAWQDRERANWSGQAGSSPYPEWQVCSYKDTRTVAKCGSMVTFTKDGERQRRWLHPDQSFGMIDDKEINMSDGGISMTTRIAVDAAGFVGDTFHEDFFPFGNTLVPLKGWQTDDLPEGWHNVNGCPITYGDQREACSHGKEPRVFQATDYPADFKIPMILDTDLGVFMDDPVALAYAAAHPRLDLRMVITTSRDTGAAALIAAKMLYQLGRTDVKIAAGSTQEPDGEQLMTPWARRAPKSWSSSNEAWLREIEAMVTFGETATPQTAQEVARIVRSLRGSGTISPERPLVYWMLGPAQSLTRVMQELSAEDKACVYLVSMGGSLVPGSRLPFGPDVGFSPWAETNVKGDDFVPELAGGGQDVAAYTKAVQDPAWAGVLLSGSEPVCDAMPGAGDTRDAWARFRVSEAGTARVVMDMLEEWAESAINQCQDKFGEGSEAPPLKCAPLVEAVHLSSHDWDLAPTQCDLMSLMPFLHPQHFLIEPKYLRFESSNGESRDLVRGCTLQAPPPEGARCLSLATAYRSPDVPAETHDDVRSTDGMRSRDSLLNAALAEMMGSRSQSTTATTTTTSESPPPSLGPCDRAVAGAVERDSSSWLWSYDTCKCPRGTKLTGQSPECQRADRRFRPERMRGKGCTCTPAAE